MGIADRQIFVLKKWMVVKKVSHSLYMYVLFYIDFSTYVRSGKASLPPLSPAHWHFPILTGPQHTSQLSRLQWVTKPPTSLRSTGTTSKNPRPFLLRLKQLIHHRNKKPMESTRISTRVQYRPNVKLFGMFTLLIATVNANSTTTMGYELRKQCL